MSAALEPAAAEAIERFIVASAYGALLGITASELEEDHVRLRLAFDPRLTTVGDLVHGGAIASLVDVAATAAAWATPRASLEARGTTVGLSLSFLAPARGCALVADARVVKRGGTLCVVDVVVEDEGGASMARALVTYKLSLPKDAHREGPGPSRLAEGKTRRTEAGVARVPRRTAVSDLSRFLEYARAFEIAQASDDFSRIAPFFAADAHHVVPGVAPLAAADAGRERVVAGLRESVHRLDRRFDTRIPEVLDGPVPRPDGIWMRFGLTLRRSGLPELRLEGEHLTAYDAHGRITRIDEKMLGGCDEEARRYLERHAEALRPVASPPTPPRGEDLPALRDALQRTLVRAYGRAKSARDVEAALAVCHPDFVIDTVPFGLATRDREDTRAQLAAFFSVFPDYRVESEGLVSGEDGAAWWGRISLTFGGALLGHRPTGRRSELPAFSVFGFRDGLVSRERFVFDLPSLCEGIGLPLPEMQGALASLRPRAATS